MLTQVYNSLVSKKNFHPTQAWLSSFIQSQKSTSSISALTQSASFRLLTTDITQTLNREASACFPTDASNANIKERCLPGPIVAQLLDVEDMSKSRWEQIEAIEALERGEGSKGREIIRVTETLEDDRMTSNAIKSGGPYKVLLQDVRGTKVYGMELRPVNGIGIGMSIGGKVLLSNVTVARGMLLLEPACVDCLGGKIEALNDAWKKSRKERLKAAIETSQNAAGHAA